MRRQVGIRAGSDGGQDAVEQDVKKESFAQHTALQINRDLRTRWPNVWNETTINERADDLLDAMKKFWPAPADWELESRE